MGGWNAVVGEGNEGNEVGANGLHKRKARGQRLFEFHNENKYVITNTWFKQDMRRRYTCKQPGVGNIYLGNRYQLDYILVKQRFRNSVLNSKKYPGALADTDHNLVVAQIGVELKMVYKGRNKKHWNTESLKEYDKLMAWRQHRITRSRLKWNRKKMVTTERQIKRHSRRRIKEDVNHGSLMKC